MARMSRGEQQEDDRKTLGKKVLGSTAKVSTEKGRIRVHKLFRVRPVRGHTVIIFFFHPLSCDRLQNHQVMKHQHQHQHKTCRMPKNKDGQRRINTGTRRRF